MTARGPTAILSEFACETLLDDLSPEAIAATKRHILDCTGVAIAATTEPSGRMVLELIREQGGTPKACVVGTGIRTNAISAAWANATLAHLLDYDDAGFSHPTACVLPAALAVAEEAQASGAELITAVCVGLEVFERLSASGRQHEPELQRRGFHPTSLYGCPAAAAAAGSILGLDAGAMAIALGLAASNGGGFTQQFGTWGKGIHAGNAARAGVTAALLAQKGYSADPEVIEGGYGFFSAFHGAGNFDFGKIEPALGSRWSVVEPGLTIKRYPCCGANLRALDAARELLSRPGITGEDVARLEVDIHPDLLCSVRFHKPEQGFRGKFSLDYVLAAMLLDGRVDMQTFTDAYCNAPRMRQALEKVRITTHPEWPGDPRTRRKSPVTFTMRNGQSLTCNVENARGSPGNPVTRDELVAKYRGCTSAVLGDARMERSIEMLEKLETIAARELVAALTP